MNRPFIEDKEIILSKDVDLLNTDVYVNSLAKVLSNSPKDTPFTIGLFGEWGSGKSSIIKTVQHRLKKIEDKEVQYVTFDAWKYVGDAFRRSFILKLQDSLGVKLDRYKYNLYESHRQKIDELRTLFKKPSKVFVWSIIGVFIVLISSFIFSSFIQNYGFKIISSLFLILTAIFSVDLIIKIINHDLFNKGLKFIYDLFHIRYDVEKPLMFSPEQFEQAFRDIIKQIEGKKLVIIVDNIDRCERNYACELLGTIKGFLECNENVVFILPVDDDALRRHITRVYQGKSKDADEFLRKFFNVTIRIKPYRANQIYKFAQEVDSQNSLNFNQLTLDLVSKEYATNPRRIIQLFNNLSSELVCFDSEFAKQNEVAICKVLIIREEFPDYYKKISSNILLLHNPDNEIMYLLENNNSLKGFLTKTNSYTDKLNNNVLQKIVSNSNVFQSLPNDIISNIENLEIKKILAYVSDNDKNKKLIIDYLVEELSTYNERGLYESYSFKNNLILLSKIDEHTLLNRVDNHRIENILNNNIKEALNDNEILFNLVRYSHTLQTQKRYYLKDFIFSRIKEASDKLYNKDGGYSETDMSIYKSKIIPIISQYISFYDTNELKKLGDIILVAYQVDYNILDVEDNNKLQYIVSENLLQYIISSLDDITNDSNSFLTLKHLLANIDIPIPVGNTLFEKLLDIFPDTDEIEALPMELIIHKLNDILNLMKPKGEYEESLTHIVSYIEDVYKSRLNFPEDISNLVDLCLNIAHVSQENSMLSYIISELLKEDSNHNIVMSKLNDAARRGNVLLYLFTKLNSLNIYENDDYLDILQYIFTNKMDSADKYWMAESVLKKKLEHIISSYLLSNDDKIKDKISHLLSRIIIDKRIKTVLAGIIISMSSQDILRLPENLQTLAIDIINTSSDKIFEFENNIDFLKTIAIKGKEKHISKLVKVINSKAQKESEVDDAFEIIMNLNFLAKKDAVTLKSFIEENYSEHEKITDVLGKIKEVS